MTLLIIWAIALVGIVYFNARFWRLFPDQEDKQYQQDKSRNIKPINPILQDTWHAVRVFIFIFLLAAVVFLICNAI